MISQSITIAVFIVYISSTYCLEDILPPFSCDGIPAGYYCTNDLTGYHHCDDNSVMTTDQCGGTTRCSCQFNMKCKAEQQKNICTEYETLHFTKNLIIGYVGKKV